MPPYPQDAGYDPRMGPPVPPMMPPGMIAPPPEQEEDKTSMMQKMLMAGLGHKALDTGLTYAVRRGGLFNNYYANAAREGMQAALTGVDLAPAYRRGFGAVSTGLSGLGDYEAAKAFAKDLQQKVYQETGVLITDINQLSRDPVAKRIIGKISRSDMSPLMRNMLGALDPKLKQNSVMEFFKRVGGMGKDNQRHSGLISSGISGLVGLATGGLPGAVGSIAANAPTAIAAEMINRGKGQGIVDFKKGLVGEGVQRGMQGKADTFGAKAKSVGLNLLDPLASETFDFGRDMGRTVNNAAENVSRFADTAAGKLRFVPGVGKVNDFVQRNIGNIRDNIQQGAQRAFIDPARRNWLARLFIRK